MKNWSKMLLKVFVYGTLRPNQALYDSLRGFNPSHKPGRVQGTLYMSGSGWYPVYKSEGNGYVIGDVLTFTEDQISTVMDILDGVEGVPYLYERITLKTEDKEEVYIYQGNNATLAKEITSGDFLNQ